MGEQLTMASVLPWLVRESQRLAQATLAGGDPFPSLWGVALDAQDWLQQASPAERETALQEIKAFLDTGVAGEVRMLTDAHEVDCLVTLLRWILDPPPVL